MRLSGREIMSPQNVLAIILAAVCAYTDIRRGLILNIVTLPAMAVGLVLNLAIGGLTGLLDAAGGLLTGFGIGYALMSLRVFFGGDLKLLIAIGALVGPRLLLQTTFWGIVLLGVQALCTLIAKGAFRRTAKSIFNWALLLQSGSKTPLPASGTTMPAAPAFLVAAIIVLI
jgi:prepilin peptidase CpaA